MLKQLAPIGIDWDSIPSSDASNLANLAALLDICYIASDAIDSACFQPLRATADLEELVGPDYRLTIEGSTGVATAKMQHWPVTAALGARWSPTATFPPTWQTLPDGSLLVREGSAALGGGSFLGSSGSDGMNEIDIQPGYVTWPRNSCRIQIAYVNGWPTAGLLPASTTTGTLTEFETQVPLSTAVPSGVTIGTPVGAIYGDDGNIIIPSGTLITDINDTPGFESITLAVPASGTASGAEIQFGYPVGVTALLVDDVTGFAGVAPTIYEGATSEQVRVTAVAADDPIEIIPGTTPVTVQAGPGTLSLALPTRRPHVGGEPASALISSIPANVRLAGYYFAGSEALQRGGTAFTVQNIPGSVQGTTSDGIGDMLAQARRELRNFARSI